MPSKKVSDSLPDSPFSKIDADPMRFLYDDRSDSTANEDNQFKLQRGLEDRYGDELDWLLTTDQNHSTLRTTPIYTRVYNQLHQQLKEHVGITVASPQFIGIACCALECLLVAGEVDWENDFKDLRGKVNTRNQTVLMRRLFDVLARGIKSK